MLDIGTGTGVLAIAAAKALRAPVLASDIDPEAVRIARENARLNGVAPLVAMHLQPQGFGRPGFARAAPFDLVFANILLGAAEAARPPDAAACSRPARTWCCRDCSPPRRMPRSPPIGRTG